MFRVHIYWDVYILGCLQAFRVFIYAGMICRRLGLSHADMYIDGYYTLGWMVQAFGVITCLDGMQVFMVIICWDALQAFGM